MKTTATVLLGIYILFGGLAARACEVCQAAQPKYLRGLSHGAGPQGRFDSLIVFSALALVVYTLVAAVRCLVHSGEKELSHIKRSIINQD